MNHYEVLYLISGAVSEDELQPIKDRVRSLIENHGGSISYEDNLGKRKLAYKIDDIRHGHYLLFEFDAPVDKIQSLDRELKLSPEVVRHTIVKRKPKTAQSMLKMRQSNDRELDTSTEKNNAQIITPKDDIKPQATPEKAPLEKPKDDKINLDDLDEKLDEILKGDIL